MESLIRTDMDLLRHGFKNILNVSLRHSQTFLIVETHNS